MGAEKQRVIKET